MSNNSKNGFSIRRDYRSYRRSLRLLQNVLHKHSGGQLANHQNNRRADNTYYPVVAIYFTGTPLHPGAPVQQPSLAYRTYVRFYGAGTSNLYGSIADAMYFVPPANPSAYGPSNPYTTIVPSSAYIISQYGNRCTLKYQSIYQNGE